MYTTVHAAWKKCAYCLILFYTDLWRTVDRRWLETADDTEALEVWTNSTCWSSVEAQAAVSEYTLQERTRRILVDIYWIM